MKSSKYPLFCRLDIEWIDASGDSGWRDISVSVPLATCNSIGRLIEDTDQSFTLCQSVSMDSTGTSVDNTIVIPKVGIVSVTELTDKKPKKRRKNEKRS